MLIYADQKQIIGVDQDRLFNQTVYQKLRAINITVFTIAWILLVYLLLVRAINRKIILFFHIAKKYRVAYLLIAPCILLIAVFQYIPVFTALVFSFTEWTSKQSPVFNRLDNYFRIFTDKYFWVGTGNMFILMVALILKKSRFRLS